MRTRTWRQRAGMPAAWRSRVQRLSARHYSGNVDGVAVRIFTARNTWQAQCPGTPCAPTTHRRTLHHCASPSNAHCKIKCTSKHAYYSIIVTFVSIGGWRPRATPPQACLVCSDACVRAALAACTSQQECGPAARGVLREQQRPWLASQFAFSVITPTSVPTSTCTRAEMCLGGLARPC